MITLYPQPILSGNIKINTPMFARKSGEDDSLGMLTQQQVKMEASRMLSGGFSRRTWRMLDLLATGGVLSSDRLPEINPRKLREWCNYRLIERISLESHEIQIQFAEIGLERSKNLYMLGPIGVEIASIRHGALPPSGYQAYTPMRIMHDIATNEIVLRLAEMIGSRGWTVDWLGKYEATLTDKSGRTILEPDAVIRFRKDGEDGGDGAFVLEYHNEDWQTRAAFKVEKYERAFSDGNWCEQWEVETFPPVLVSFLKPIVGAGYQNATKGKKLNCVYYGKTFKSVLEGNLDEWVNIAKGMKRENILPGGQTK
jgi:hypothetical protein